LGTLDLGTLAASGSVDAYFEVEITQVSGASGYQRGYYIVPGRKPLKWAAGGADLA